MAYGTPFAGELARGRRQPEGSARCGYPLAQGPENRIEEVSAAEAARGFLANVLFFAEDAELVQAVFRSALDFVERVPVRRLTCRAGCAGLEVDSTARCRVDSDRSCVIRAQQPSGGVAKAFGAASGRLVISRIRGKLSVVIP